MTADILRLILEAVMSGTLIVTLVTLRSTRKKASEEARAIEIDNSQKLLSNFQQFIVEPLKKEVNALRKDVCRLNRAVEKIPACPHAAQCPVSRELQTDADDTADDARDQHDDPPA